MGLAPAAAAPRILAGGKMTKQPTDRTTTMLLAALLMTNGGDVILKRVDPSGERFQSQLLSEVHDIGATLERTNMRLNEVLQRLEEHDRHSNQAKPR